MRINTNRLILSLVLVICVGLAAGCATTKTLIKAAKEGDTAALEALLAKGADINAKDKDDRTALMMAAANGHTATVQTLVEAGADVRMKGPGGFTALILAAANGHTTIVQALVEAGADANTKVLGGLTALMMASLSGHTATVKALLKLGVDVNAKDKAGQTALNLAASRGHTDVVRIIREAGAKDENLCIDFLSGEDWCLGHTIEDDFATLAEFVKRGETLDNWTELITIITTKNKTMDNLDPLVKTMQESHRSRRRCTKGGWLEVRSRESISGVPARVLVGQCLGIAKSPDVAKSAWGTSETQVTLIVAGRQNLYMIQRTARNPELDSKTVDKWIAFLKTARICDSHIHVQPCD